MATKIPIRLASVFAEEAERVELPNGQIAPVRPIDGIGYDLYTEMEADPEKNAHLIWEITARCLPRDDTGTPIPLETIKGLTPAECAAVLAVAVGRVALVEQLARVMEGNAGAPVTTAEPESPKSSTLSVSCVPESPESSVSR